MRVRRTLIEGTTWVSLDDLLAVIRARAANRHARGLDCEAAALDELADDVVSAWLAGSVNHLGAPDA